MRILIGWDDAEEAELIALYLQAGDHEAVVALDAQSFLRKATESGPWDVVLLAIDFPDPDNAFSLFQTLHDALPDCPIVGACQSNEVVQLARFLTAGMRSYVLRDVGGEFVFLLLTTLESTAKAVHAEYNRHVAERLREEAEAVNRFASAMIADHLFAPTGYAVAGRYEPSEIQVRGDSPVVLAGGDFYDLFSIDRHRSAIVMADAAGHGMQACMSLTILNTHLQMLQKEKIRSAADFVTELNRRFCEHRIVKRQGSLTAVLFGVLRSDRHAMTWTSAGHPLPLLQERDGNRFSTLGNHDVLGPPLGVDEDISYREFSVRIPPHSRILCYTDGLTEASPDENSGLLFGLEGVKKTLTRVCDYSAGDAVRTLFRDSAAFTQGVGRHDDTSALILDRI